VVYAALCARRRGVKGKSYGQGGHSPPRRDSSSGKRAMFAAIRRASSHIRTFACRSSFALFIANPGAELRTSELFEWAYPRLDKIERNHREVIGRAAKKVAVRVGRDRHKKFGGGVTASYGAPGPRRMDNLALLLARHARDITK
jgi:hypothetical protein